jgi:hypothetical protein
MLKRPLTGPRSGFLSAVSPSPRTRGEGSRVPAAALWTTVVCARLRADPSFWQNQIEFSNEISRRTYHALLGGRAINKIGLKPEY